MYVEKTGLTFDRHLISYVDRRLARNERHQNMVLFVGHISLHRKKNGEECEEGDGDAAAHLMAIA